MTVTRVKHATLPKAPAFQFTPALKKLVVAYVKAAKSVPLDRKPSTVGFHRTLVRVIPTTTSSIATYAWYNPSSRKMLREVVSGGRLHTPTESSWATVSGKLPAVSRPAVTVLSRK